MLIEKGVDGEIRSSQVIGKSLPEECHSLCRLLLFNWGVLCWEDWQGWQGSRPGGSGESAVLSSSFSLSRLTYLLLTVLQVLHILSFKEHSFLSVILKVYIRQPWGNQAALKLYCPCFEISALISSKEVTDSKVDCK